MTSSPTQRRIICWTHPRSVSTAFERAFMQRPDTQAFHEPYGEAYYFGPERRSPRYRDQAPDEKLTFDAITKALLGKLGPGKTLAMSKDMAYYVPESLLDQRTMGSFVHTFLVRTPKRSVPSLYRLSLESAKTGWSYFLPEEAGFVELARMFDFATGVLRQRAIVIDAEDLISSPKAVLYAYCSAIGVEFRPEMLTWSPGHVPEFDRWRGWHDDAMHSSGFGKARPEQAPKREAPNPPEVEETIARSMPYYQKLSAHRLAITG